MTTQQLTITELMKNLRDLKRLPAELHRYIVKNLQRISPLLAENLSPEQANVRGIMFFFSDKHEYMLDYPLAQIMSEDLGELRKKRRRHAQAH